MATATGLTAATGPPTTGSQHSNTSIARPSGRAVGNKSLDIGRKQSPVDPGARRQAAPKAWATGTNPLTQRGPTPTQQNGNAGTSKTSSGVKPTSKEMGISDKQAHDRLAFIITAAMGLGIILTTRAGETFEGLLGGSVLTAGNQKITIKMARKIAGLAAAQSGTLVGREASLIGSSPDHSLNFELRDVVDITLPEFAIVESSKAVNGTSSGFQTDTDISRNANRGERTLQPWVPDGADNTDYSLESNAAGDWDQFAANKTMFGARSTYDENLYTTAIDRSAPSYRKREAEAARIARDIENTTSQNPHLREERGQALEREDEDEEDKYSGVRRGPQTGGQMPPSNGVDKYMPPARRAPVAQSIVPGVPVDPAIVSAQVSRTNTPKSSTPQPKLDKAKIPPVTSPEPEINQVEASTQDNDEPLKTSVTPTDIGKDKNVADNESAQANTPTAAEATRKAPGVVGEEDGVAKEVLQQFRKFADAEKQKLADRRKAQANQDRTARFNELVRFSKTFKLKTPIPTDLVGILAKDPAKQEAIIERAQKEHEDAKTVTVSPTAVSSTTSPTRKGEAGTNLPMIPDRQNFNRGRGGYPASSARLDRSIPQQGHFATKGANANLPMRPLATQLDRQGSQASAIPAPIPILDGRNPPTGPSVDHSGVTSPQRSTMHTPASTSSSRFNLNVKASEFRPNAAAATFNPTASSNAPSSPASMQRTGSISRTASPSTFFGSRKPKPLSERPSITTAFDSIKRMKDEVLSRKDAEKTANSEDAARDQKSYASNGGIPNAYQTGPRWTVREENSERSFVQVYDRPVLPQTSPVQVRSNSSHHVPYHQSHPLHGSSSSIPQLATPQHGIPGGPHHYSSHYEDGHQRMHMPGGSPHVYPSPSMSNRQVSAYASPMGNAAQLAYAQPSYFGGPVGQVSMPMRQFPGTPGMMHAQPGQMTAPMMAQQQSNGPYMAMPQQFNPQTSMYSPSPMHVYPQHNGYPSPGRMAPMMMQQNSQQGQHSGQPMMISMSSQGAHMGYGQQSQMNMHRGSFAGQGYGSGPHPHPLQQRALSSGYGHMHQKPQNHHMHHNHGPNMGNQVSGYGQMDVGPDEDK